MPKTITAAHIDLQAAYEQYGGFDLKATTVVYPDDAIILEQPLPDVANMHAEAYSSGDRDTVKIILVGKPKDTLPLIPDKQVHILDASGNLFHATSYGYHFLFRWLKRQGYISNVPTSMDSPEVQRANRWVPEEPMIQREGRVKRPTR